MITAAEYAKLADAAYPGKATPEGWVRLKDSPANDPTGYQGVAFQNAQGEIVIANRGTEPTSGQDWNNNLQMGINQLPDQYQSAREFYAQVLAENSSAKISVTGHSLGGALAQMLAAESTAPGNKTLEATTFNPYGAKDLIPALNGRYGLSLDPEASYANISNHQTSFDGVSRLPFSEHLGSMQTHAAPSELPVMLGLSATLGQIGNSAASLYYSHSIDRFTQEIYGSTPLNISELRQQLSQWMDGMLNAAGNAFLNTFLPEGSRPIDIGTSTFFYSAGRFVQPIRRDPLTLDLDGDGLETVGTSAGILFDQTGSGVKQGTGWVKADDGFLVLDRNGNGTIDSGRELFGDSTIKSNGQTALDGFDALADLDSNADGKITSADTRFGNLRVLIESAGQHESWTTTGVSTDVIGASWRALIDAIEYKLMRDKAWAGC